NGVAQGSEFVAGTTHGILRSLIGRPDGTFVVAWHNDYFLQPPAPGVFAQRFDRTGQALGAPYALNMATRDAREPALAVDSDGSITAAWNSFDAPDGSASGVLARRFPALRAAALVVDPQNTPPGDGNGVFDPGEGVIVAPAWRNATQVSEAFTGQASSFTGPGAPDNPTYTITDGAAMYDAAAAGQ